MMISTVGCYQPKIDQLNYMRLAVGCFNLLVGVLLFVYGTKRRLKAKRFNAVLQLTFGTAAYLTSFGLYLILSMFQRIAAGFFRTVCVFLIAFIATPQQSVFIDLCRSLRVSHLLPYMMRTTERIRVVNMIVMMSFPTYVFLTYAILPPQEFYIHGVIGIFSTTIALFVGLITNIFLHRVCLKALEESHAEDQQENNPSGGSKTLKVVVSKEFLIQKLKFYSFGFLINEVVGVLVTVVLGIGIYVFKDRKDEVIFWQVIVWVADFYLALGLLYTALISFAKIRKNILGKNTKSKTNTKTNSTSQHSGETQSELVSMTITGED